MGKGIVIVVAGVLLVASGFLSDCVHAKGAPPGDASSAVAKSPGVILDHDC